MRYVSLDIETTGLNPETCDVLEVGAYIEDTDVLRPRNELPSFHKYIFKENYRGEPYAIAMNAHIFQKILALRKQWTEDGQIPPTLTTPEGLVCSFARWMADNNLQSKPVLAGKNIAGFDIPFLNTISTWKTAFKFHHRVIDPGMMYFDPRNDLVPPDLKECKKRAKLPEHVTHEALDDAWDVIQLVREKYPLI